jgi:glycerol-1-phosphate dehydrogenase [NAD(P)+]
MAVVQNHRYKRVDTMFTDTGFWDYVETLNLNVEDYEKAIDLAPSIKPYRYTYLHNEEYREQAKKVLREDAKLRKVFHI